ncbi:SET domain-containing protein [bacterium]|nr:MAG: SET domain-containing protein [bacterium]
MKKEQKDLREQLQVKRSIAGLGLFTKQPIKKGSFIIEYVGPLLNDEQVQKKGGKYLFALGKKWTIDGTNRKNIARYINHSCLPNCEPIQYAQRIKIKAKRNIKAGEELFYDYGKEYFDEFIGKHCRCPKHSKAKKSSRNNK